jgi:parvulin-like peptidyl-prolyl isomerase
VISNDPLDPTTTDVAPIPTSTLEVTPTPDEPMVATVNGEGIRLQDYEDELRRYEAAVVALGNDYDEALGSEIVLNNLIDTILLAQAARTNGFDLTTENYDLKLQELISSAGGESQFQEWMQTNFYTQESFDRLYKLEIEATWMRDKIIAEVPTRDEQIRARQILVSSRSLADDIYTQLENGADFDYYAWGYDQLAGGELGWFPRAYLVLPEIEQAVFNLQPGEYSQVIESTYGYHIVQVMERALDRSLTQDALIQKQKKAIANWLSSQKESSSIVLN